MVKLLPYKNFFAIYINNCKIENWFCFTFINTISGGFIMKATKENVTDAEYSFLKKVGVAVILVVSIGCYAAGYVVGKTN